MRWLPSSHCYAPLGRPASLALLGAGLSWIALSAALAQDTATFTTLYSFNGGSDGLGPSSLVQGRDGNFYGTADGTIFQVTPAGKFKTLYSSGGSDDFYPSGDLALGSDGNFYGLGRAGADDAGALFQFTPAGALTVLHSFDDTDALSDYALVQGSDGNFYDTTVSGGAGSTGPLDPGVGTVFQITPEGGFTILHSFDYTDGANPLAGLVQGSDGDFYGTTNSGGPSGASGVGTVFKITSEGVFTTLHSFSTYDGAYVSAGLVQGSDGNFYGTTDQGGASNDGTVFRITPAGTLTTLYNFGGASNGGSPQTALVQGSDGTFYGTTTGAGTTGGGTVFEITPSGVLTTLHSFNGSNGYDESRPLVQGNDGSFYGTTGDGGDNGDGTIFKLTVYPAFFTGQTALTNGVYYLGFSGGNYFGYYTFLEDPHYIYHFDLGYEYVFNANDGDDGVYLYDFESNDFLYTSPTFPFPYLYDFNLNSVVYYYPDPGIAGRYNTDGVRYFYVFNTGEVISK